MGCESRDAMGEVSNTLQAYFLSANNQAYAMRNKCVAYIMTQREPTGLQWCLLNSHRCRSLDTGLFYKKYEKKI